MLIRQNVALGCLTALLLVGATVSPALAGDVVETEIKQTEGGSSSGSSGTDAAPADDGLCHQADGTPLECETYWGVWNGTCYERVFVNGPADGVRHVDEPEFGLEGDVDLWAMYAPGGYATTTGVIVQCFGPNGEGDGHLYWRESAEPPPSAAELQQAALLMLKNVIVAPGIGVFPGAIDGTDPDVVGIVGWPVWLWADNPGPGVAAPLTQSTSVRGYTLRATARLDNITYDTGDGDTVRCHLGAEPVGNDRHEPAHPPPPCSHTYAQRGSYTITATTHVTIDWAAAGRSGSIAVTVDRSGRYDVAEIQVLIVPNKPG